MQYLYYPGCSLESAARQYDESLRVVFESLGLELKELEDWNCCGATMYMSVDETSSLAISARNLALAEQNGNTELIAPCSACYTVLLKTNRFLEESPELRKDVDRMLNKVGLHYDLTVRIRHPLDVLVNDVGLEAIRKAARVRLEGVAFASYYGCQIVRPERGFDHPEFPDTLDHLFESLGAESVYFPAKTRCCGGMLMTTYPDVCLELVKELLECAAENGAQCMLTTCPLCQVNVESYQKQINRKYGASFDLPVMFFTQLLGMALGCPEKELGLYRNLVPLTEPLSTLAV
jgi:heterodisulfide reductase subunit B